MTTVFAVGSLEDVRQGVLDRHKDRIVGVLSGFDSLLFRGTLRSISYLTGMDKFLNVHGVLYKH